MTSQMPTSFEEIKFHPGLCTDPRNDNILFGILDACPIANALDNVDYS
jgi:hypothetical protein